ncbi:AarF/ABC1/UbiB kinase family protein [Candidatus Uhrbacteria bacterium]|nr:AarF/ABC1/UbiB kinase family protein [Candidatus Uhrbacteria bacterium]
MDFVHGVKADDVSGIHKLRSNAKQLALHGLGAMFQQFLIDGFFHADPHPGNFFAMKNNMLCLHDFGMVGYLTSEQCKELVSCFVAFEQKNIDSFLKHFMHLAIASNESDVAGFQKDASGILSDLFFTPHRSSVAWAFFRLINNGAKRNICFPPDLALFGKAIITTEAMGLKLYPRFDFNKEFHPFVEQALRSYLDPSKAIQEFKTDIFDYLGLLKTLPDRTQGVLNKIERGELGVRIDAAELLGIKTEFDRQNDLRILGAATITLFFVSSMFAYWEGKTSIGGVPLSSIGLAIATILLLWLVTRIAQKPA